MNIFYTFSRYSRLAWSLLLVICLLLIFVLKDGAMQSFLLGACLAMALVRFGEDAYKALKSPEEDGAERGKKIERLA